MNTSGPTVSILTVFTGAVALAVFSAGLGEHRETSHAASPESATLKKLKITFETSRVEKAGTDSDIYVAVSYRTPMEGAGAVYLLPTHKDDMEKGQSNSYALSIPPGSRLDGKEIDQITAITVFNAMKGDKPGWHVASVEVRALGSDGHTYMLSHAPVNRWLDSKEPDGPALCVPLKLPYADMGPGDTVGETKEWKAMK